jgi:hypothetical protein
MNWIETFTCPFEVNWIIFNLSVFWFTSATVYQRVNPDGPEPISVYDDYGEN